MKLSDLGSDLEYDIIKLIKQIIGDRQFDTSSNTGDLTWIQGTPVPVDDASGNRGSDAIDLQLWTDQDTEVAGGDYSGILCGGENTIESQGDGAAILGGFNNYIGDGSAGGDFSLAAGTGAIAISDHQFAFGSYYSVYGDAQASWHTQSSTMAITDSWNDLFSFDVPTDTTWTFLALITGIRQGATESFSYKVEGCIENDGGTVSLLASTVTTIYEDDASYALQAVADDSSNELEFQLQDTDNSGASSRWHCALHVSEIAWAA